MKIVVYGAGGIGCYVGGRLAATGAPVTFVGRQRLADELATHGLRLTDYLGADLRVDHQPAEARRHRRADVARPLARRRGAEQRVPVPVRDVTGRGR